eukprot:CAMPEP_0174362182 /NCGR_PEP_ID=MMETSP0811_2-20130205/63149_1 /TAXON_ID=73025 ORGANISM="Eutreptiella gymnastica-like, Strain CCMP1594" /NCGR_SAMPLE_ID=MMETSP0811_2 /ASSEMBLY_ACC=CAM_ASM_000667 /LENGTH=116 /DNA_ID=CAMNT_0015499619 /DNA_START=189 /DNA_END=539 /DNA_ORIENTATION=-
MGIFSSMKVRSIPVVRCWMDIRSSKAASGAGHYATQCIPTMHPTGRSGAQSPRMGVRGRRHPMGPEQRLCAGSGQLGSKTPNSSALACGRVAACPRGCTGGVRGVGMRVQGSVCVS